MLCPTVNTSASLIFSTCRVLIMAPFNSTSAGALDAVTIAGSYDTPFRTPIETRLMAEAVFIDTTTTSFSIPPVFRVDFVEARAVLCSYCNPQAPPGTLGLGSSGQDWAKIYGSYADYVRFLMALAIFLLSQVDVCVCVVLAGNLCFSSKVFLSLLLTWERRNFQFLQLLLSGLVIVQDLLILIFTSRSVLSGNSDINTLCLGLGSVFHLFVMSCVVWYGAASLNVFFVFAFAGKLDMYAYPSSARNKLVYHLVCWSIGEQRKSLGLVFLNKKRSID